MEHEVVVVVSGGEPPDPRAALAAPPDAPVVAADKGLEHALALGLEVTVAVGDFDSASPATVTAAEREGTRIERHPPEKDAADIELALDSAAALEPARVLVLAGAGGRLDHLLSTLLLLASERYAGIEIDALLGSALVQVVRGSRVFEGAPGDLVSLLAVAGPAEGVSTDGLVYPLRGEALEAGSTRGVSNIFESARARVAVERGVLLAIRPGATK